jgi:hypothetical protein
MRPVLRVSAPIVVRPEGFDRRLDERCKTAFHSADRRLLAKLLQTAYRRFRKRGFDLVMPRERPRSRSRRRVAAISLAGFLALFGYEAARMHNGDNPELARVSKKAAATNQSSSSSQSRSQRQGSSPSNAHEDGYGSGGSAQDYYTPPQSDTPTTGSS